MAFRRDIATTVLVKLFRLLNGFACSLLLARCLKPDGFGVFTAIMVLPMILISLGELGLRQSAAYFVGKGIASEQRIAGALAAIWIVVSILLSVVVLGSYSLQGILKEYPVAAWLGMAFVATSLVTRFANGLALGNQWIGRINLGEGLFSVMRLVLTVLLLVFVGAGVAGAVCAEAIAALAPGILMLLWLSRDRHISIAPVWDWDLTSRLLVHGVRFAVALFVLMLNYRVNILILRHYVSDSDLGQYGLSIRIAELTWLLPLAMGTVVFSHSTGAKDVKAFSRSAVRAMRLTLLVCTLGAMAVAVVGPFLVPLVFGPEYAASMPVLHVLLPGIVAAVVFKVLGPDLAGRGRPLVGMWASVAALVVNVLLNFILVPRNGVIGSAIALSTSYVVGAGVFLIIYARTTGIALREFALRRSDFPVLTTGLSYFGRRTGTGDVR